MQLASAAEEAASEVEKLLAAGVEAFAVVEEVEIACQGQDPYVLAEDVDVELLQGAAGAGGGVQVVQ